ncbi:low affinity iron permease family protein [Flavisolibacter nicotianae]|uniref:low affinity iron permease family protein n=1 Tax=Flavisolibacter nicotianae TaxID=2364882 RepID=UPI001F094161|nr:low affinity iron permease family protein [Flavisolibacter nicotianae]
MDKYGPSPSTVERALGMKQKQKKGFKIWFERMAARITKVAGSSTSFLLAVLIIVAWGVTGPIFHFSDTWQLVINTGTTIVTFLMVFIIQQSQNKDSLAIQLKLNELIAAEERASNRLIVVEDLSQDELEILKKFYVRLSDLAKEQNDLHSSHSVDEAREMHEHKRSIRQHDEAKQQSPN